MFGPFQMIELIKFRKTKYAKCLFCQGLHIQKVSLKSESVPTSVKVGNKWAFRKQIFILEHFDESYFTLKTYINIFE